MTPQHGRCLCGGIGFQVDALPSRVTICHCRYCQRVTGGPYLVEPIFDRRHFRVTKGTPRVFESTSGGSGKIVYLNFCGTCGGRIFLEFERFAGFVGVYAGVFDDPVWFPVGPENARHIFVGQARSDTVIAAGMPVFADHAIEQDGSPRVATLLKAPTRASKIDFSA